MTIRSSRSGFRRGRGAEATRAALLGAAAVTAVLATACAPAARIDGRYPVVPTPRALEPAEGEFRLDERTRIALSDPADPEMRRLARFLAEPLRTASGLPLPIADDPAPAGTAATPGLGGVIALRLEADGQDDARPGPTRSDERPDEVAEDYRLSVRETGVSLAAPTPAGLFRGIQTLLQLLPPAVADGIDLPPRHPATAEVAAATRAPPTDAPTTAAPSSAIGDWTIPAVEIRDAPRFRYRGMHLDAGRHVFPVEFVKRYIDLLAFYKFNRFHWHLTEDQGWRIEIRKYPRLAEVGGCRSETQVGRDPDPWIGDGREYCGFYTQDEVREVVAYAAERHITVIPEIEMPGHSSAALAAYPELACTEGPFEVGTRWGIYEDIYCPSETTFAFLEDVLTEVMELFPSRYIHIGGDEAPKRVWEESALAQEVIRREGLADEDELQSWFIGRIARFLREHDRRIIGWDEILEGGLPEGATVMSWRGMDGGIEAARQGADVIMAPTSHVYFDYYQGDPENEPLAIGGYLPLDTVYAFEPVADALGDDEAEHVLGGQANVWTEYMKTPEHVEYMAFPRVIALSEVLWSPRDARDRDSFLRRLPFQLERLDRMGVNYRTPDALTNEAAPDEVTGREADVESRPGADRPAPAGTTATGSGGPTASGESGGA